MHMSVYNHLLNIISSKGAAYLVLIDPEGIDETRLEKFVNHCESSGVDGFLVGGSLLVEGTFELHLKKIKNATELPVIIFPGSVEQVCKPADAVLYLSVVSGRNPEHLIGKHVIAAPLIKSLSLEPISTGYILVESGKLTTAQYMSGSLPVPRNKPQIAAATALAAEYMGMKMIYLEAGSGADMPVADDMIKAVSGTCSIPLIVGGGLRSPQTARAKVKAGANIIVTGNFFEDENNWGMIKLFAEAVHVKLPVTV